MNNQILKQIHILFAQHQDLKCPTENYLDMMCEAVSVLHATISQIEKQEASITVENLSVAKKLIVQSSENIKNPSINIFCKAKLEFIEKVFALLDSK